MKKKIKVFGLSFLDNGSPFRGANQRVKFRNNPDKWTWTPSNPNKIKHRQKIMATEVKAEKYAAQTNYRPCKEKQRVVLLFSFGLPDHIILSNFRKRGIKYFFLSYDSFMLQGDLRLVFDLNYEKKFLKIKNAKLNLDDVACVIWPGPGGSILSDIFSSETDKKGESKDLFIFKKRWLQFLKDLKGILPPETKWFPSHPFNGSQEWQNKHGEYSTAMRMGLKIPPTLFTNSYEELIGFTKRHGDKLILREFSCPPRNFPPKRIDLAKVKGLSTLKTSPCTFQKYIEKEYELRIVYFGGKVYPCKIYSQDSKIPEARFDWRFYDNASVRWELSKIPNLLEKKIIKFMKALDLEWGSLDFIKSIDGDFYFLEVNRPGAFYWLEPFAGLNMGEIIADHLVKKNIVETY